MITSGSLFTGYAGLDMAVEQVLGIRTVWHCENDAAASRVLVHRFPGVPNHGDVTEVDWSTVEPIDLITGGFPCQDVSAAGKRAGLRPGTRSGLWSHMAYAIGQLRPRLVVAENVRGLLSAEAHSDMELCPWCLGDESGEPAVRALGAVLADLAILGYDARWYGLRAADVGAPHSRFRVFIVAEDADRATRDERWQSTPREAEAGGGRPDAGRRSRAPAANTDEAGLQGPQPAARRPVPAGRAPANPSRDGRHEGRPEPAGQFGRPDAAERSAASARSRCQPRCQRGRDWRASNGDDYGPAVRRWHDLTFCVPPPTGPSPRGGERLSPQFVEWMMGLPTGWVTDVPGISSNDQLRMLGNGVVPQQAAAALQQLLAVPHWKVAA